LESPEDVDLPDEVATAFSSSGGASVASSDSCCSIAPKRPLYDENRIQQEPEIKTNLQLVAAHLVYRTVVSRKQFRQLRASDTAKLLTNQKPLGLQSKLELTPSVVDDPKQQRGRVVLILSKGHGIIGSLSSIRSDKGPRRPILEYR
jgi:hypothetical protein